MSIKISNVSITNFKLFDKFNNIVDVEKDNLILFDGPNGYGKTSVFDAIELALTGRIKRVDNNAQLFDGKNAYKNFILVKDESKEAEVSVTLVDENKKLKLIRKYIPEHLGEESIEKNPQKIFEKFKLICELNDEVVEEGQENSVLKDFGILNFNEIFDKCCYLSQDENLAFFKEGDKERTQALDFLFDTNVEEKAVSNIEKVQKRYDKVLKIYKANIKSFKKDIEEKNKIVSQKKDNVGYVNLFIKSDVVWDKENYDVNESNYKKIENELDDFIYVSSNLEQCLLFIKRNKYKYLLNQYSDDINKLSMKDNSLQYTLNYYKKLDSYKKISNLYEYQQNLINEKQHIENKEYKDLNIDIIKKLMDYSDEEVKELNKSINEIEEIKKNENTLSSVISNMNSTRTKIMNMFKNDVLVGVIQDSVCPLCGNDWTSKEELLKAVENQKQELKKLCNNDTLKREKVEKDLCDKFIDNVLKEIEINTKEMVNKEYVLTLKKACTYKESMDKIIKELDIIKVNIQDKMTVEGYISKNDYMDIYNLIDKNVPECTAEINDKLEKMNFKRYYEKYLDSDVDELSRISLKLVKEKQKYIDFLYYNSVSKEISVLKNNLDKLEGRTGKLEDVINELKYYVKIKKDAIITYKKNIIKDIEPLLYVYSSKIIQQKFGGNNIQIDNTKLKNFKIVSNFNNDQDIIHSMSSGQLTSVSLAFLLCMNKVYCSNKFNILLIDDPLQTVDDVNMVGFVDLIRHEFSDIQIIVATHEKDFANYIAYKFIKAGHTYKNYNMRKLMLSNNAL
ncbi:exonuclease SbcC [Clostridium moniliforme]|uniref:Nuclease SbcCD subunit C n=1 Tax=Clostridium moniliforme TaxID=39489 RepID=A0ABS4F1I7_9CLOT|nr:AAA family ATPase [Clostridium moniliforme]MBP1890119.1 exonuclease SbcC [Clostridium moniliforme]